MKGEIESLQLALRSAFKDVTYPGDNNLVSSETSYPSEPNSIANFLRRRDRSDVRLESLTHEYEGDASAILSFVTDKAFVYYLPAFLDISLNEFEKSDLVGEAGFSIFVNSVRGNLEVDEFRAKRRRLLNLEQLKVIHKIGMTISKRIGDKDPFFLEVIKNIEIELEKR